MGLSSKEAVLAFLEVLKRAVAEFGLFVVPRSENNNTLKQLGLTKRNQEDIIFSLTPADYVKGPEEDRDKPGEIWVFGKRVGKCLLYFKFKIMNATALPRAKCISFHIAEEPMKFPHGEEEVALDE